MYLFNWLFNQDLVGSILIPTLDILLYGDDDIIYLLQTNVLDAPPTTPLVNLEKMEKELCQKVSIKELQFQSPARLLTQAFAGMDILSPVHSKSSSSIQNKNSGPKKSDHKNPTSSLSSQNKNSKINKQERSNCSLLPDIDIGANNKSNLTCTDQTQLISEILTKHKLAFEQFEAEYESTMSRISELLEINKKAFKRYRVVHENTIQSLSSIVDANRTTPKRNSIRLHNKNSIPKCAMSPRIEKSSNLLKSLLKKKFSEEQDKESPRTKKAMDLYRNTMRINDTKILETPRINMTTQFNTPKSHGMKNLSMKIQKQCLLLQDTPR